LQNGWGDVGMVRKSDSPANGKKTKSGKKGKGGVAKNPTKRMQGKSADDEEEMDDEPVGTEIVSVAPSVSRAGEQRPPAELPIPTSTFFF
jgi:hypothetical protein